MNARTVTGLGLLAVLAALVVVWGLARRRPRTFVQLYSPVSLHLTMPHPDRPELGPIGGGFGAGGPAHLVETDVQYDEEMVAHVSCRLVEGDEFLNARARLITLEGTFRAEVDVESEEPFTFSLDRYHEVYRIVAEGWTERRAVMVMGAFFTVAISPDGQTRLIPGR